MLQAKRDIADAAGAKFAARSPRQHSALVLIHRTAGPEDVLEAFCFGLLLADPKLLQSRQVTANFRALFLMPYNSYIDVIWTFPDHP